VIVLASAFNATGANAELASGTGALPDAPAGAELWRLHDGRVEGAGRVLGGLESAEDGGLLHLARVIAGLLLLLVPGALALAWFVPRPSLAEAVGMAPALSSALLVLAGIAVLAVLASPFSSSATWLSVALATGLGVVLAVSRGLVTRRSWERALP
jgi:uncharacterized membrane protein SirB2